MADVIRRIDYFKAQVPDKAGVGAKILSVLSREGADLLFFTGFPRGRKAQLDFVPKDAAAFRKAARKAKISVTRKTAFLIQGEDRTGAIAGIAAKLAEAGINITAVDAIAAGGDRYGAILWVRPADVRKAAKALDAR